MEIIGWVVHIQKQLFNDGGGHSLNVQGCQLWLWLAVADLGNHWLRR
jgi:hypothetical protein